jgi:hypothetical protein
MPAEKPTEKTNYCFLNAYKVVRKAPQPSPCARVVTHGFVLGYVQYKAGNSRDKRKAYDELYRRYHEVIKEDGAIYKKPTAVALWIYGESFPPEDWVDE